MRHLVTGGGGFVGRAVAAALVDRGADVTLLAREGSRSSATARSFGIPEIAYSSVDEVAEAVAHARPDIVIHLAAEQIRAPRGPADIAAVLEANVQLGTLILDGVRDTDAVVVQAMSYFQFRDGLPGQHSLYSATKEALRSIGAFYRELEGVDVRDVVLYDNYGPDDSRDKLVPYLVRAIETDAVATIGPLEQTINLLHVDDVASGLLAAAAPGAAETTTVRAPEATTVGEIIATLERIRERLVRYEVDATRPVSDLPLHAGDWPAPPGWSPARSLETGLAQLVGSGATGT